jgi:hypothetical protein
LSSREVVTFLRSEPHLAVAERVSTFREDCRVESRCGAVV